MGLQPPALLRFKNGGRCVHASFANDGEGLAAVETLYRWCRERGVEVEVDEIDTALSSLSARVTALWITLPTDALVVEFRLTFECTVHGQTES